MIAHYKQRKIDGRMYYVHRLVWEEANGPIPEGMTIDHINGDRFDNTLSNLRMVTQQENTKNSAKNKTNTSGVSGVSWCKRRSKWRAYVRVSYNQITLGTYVDWFDAVCARMSANNSHGFHANHGRQA